MKIPASQVSPYMGGATARLHPENPRGGKTPPNVKARDGPIFTDRIVSLPEASAISGLSVDTLRRCHKRQELEIIKLSPRRVGIRLSFLWAFIDARAT
jgi:hypothetical protein